MRLIDADTLKDRFNPDFFGYGQLVEMIETAPTVDAKPMVLGKWVERSWRSEDDPEYVRFSIHCSQCNQQRVDGIHLANYCPKCGAKMSDGKDDTQ